MSSTRNQLELEATQRREITRRWFLSQCGLGLGSIALGSLLAEDAAADKVNIDPLNPLAPREPHFAPRAKRVIYLFMAGGPSQLELFDDKPKLGELNGQKPPEGLLAGRRFAFLKGNETLLGPTRKFARYGQCGMSLSELVPHHRSIADEVCWLQGMTTDVFNHGPAKLFMNTGFQVPGRPGLGAWVTYGLGSPSRDLPGFVVLQSGPRGPRAGVFAVEQRLSAVVVPGRAAARQRRPDPAPAQPGRHRSPTRARFLQHAGRAESGSLGRNGRPRNPHPDQRL